MRDAFLDLVLGGRCAACARPGRWLCAACEGDLPDEAFAAWPDPVPAGLAPPHAAGEYAAGLRALVVAHKEHRAFALRRPLARLLALSAAASAPTGPVLLVPVPSRPGVARTRGHDPTGALVDEAGRVLRRAGREVRVARLLRSRGGADQAGLGAAERAANLDHSLHCPAGRLRALAGVRARLVVCDDVLTTGSTAREAQRALEAQGLAVSGVAVVAATRRRRTGPPLSPRPPTD